MSKIEIMPQYENDGLLSLRIKHYIKKGMREDAVIEKMKPYKIGLHYTIRVKKCN